MAHGQGGAEVNVDLCPTLTVNHEQPILAHSVVGPLCAQHAHVPQQSVFAGHLIAHALTRSGGSEDGTGRGIPLVPVGFSGKDSGGDAAGDVAPTLRAGAHDRSHANGGNWPAVAYPLDLRNAGRDPEKHDAVNRQGVGVGEAGDPAPACTRGPVPGVAYAFQPRIGRSGRGQPSDVVPALAGADAGATSDSRPCIATAYAVRRLTPRECERLQGFPEDYTLVLFRGKPAADGPRYRALGNSMATPVMAWIGQRIEAVEGLL